MSCRCQNSPGPGTQSAHNEQLVHGPGRRPGRAHEQSVLCGPGRRPEHLHALVFDLVNHTSLQFLMIHISFQESFRKIEGENNTKHVKQSLWFKENAETH